MEGVIKLARQVSLGSIIRKLSNKHAVLRRSRAAEPQEFYRTPIIFSRKYHSDLIVGVSSDQTWTLRRDFESR